MMNDDGFEEVEKSPLDLDSTQFEDVMRERQVEQRERAEERNKKREEQKNDQRANVFPEVEKL